MAEKLIHIFKELLNLVCPQKCIDCGAPNVILCDKCLDSFPPPPFFGKQGIFAATSYDDEIVRKAIRLFKYRGVKTLAAPLAELIRRSLDKARLFSIFERSLASVVIIPIPLSPKRLRQRGYNQSELIGHFLSDRLSVRMEADILIKIKDTPSQVEIKDRKERLKNLQGAFAVKNPEEIKDKIVILVDDIITTGATLNEAKKVLKQSGAKKVFGVAVAG